jgi:hypothetical protein
MDFRVTVIGNGYNRFQKMLLADAFRSAMLLHFAGDVALLTVAYNLHKKNPRPSDVVPSVELRYERAFEASYALAFEVTGIEHSQQVVFHVEVAQ